MTVNETLNQIYEMTDEDQEKIARRLAKSLTDDAFIDIVQSAGFDRRLKIYDAVNAKEFCIM